MLCSVECCVIVVLCICLVLRLSCVEIVAHCAFVACQRLCVCGAFVVLEIGIVVCVVFCVVLYGVLCVVCL